MPDEADPQNYGPAKVACERLISTTLGDRAFIVRAGLIGGPRDPINRFGHWPLRLSQGGEVPAPGSPDDAVRYVDVEDLAGWIVSAAEERVVGAATPGSPRAPRRSVSSPAFSLFCRRRRPMPRGPNPTRLVIPDPAPHVPARWFA